MFKFADDIDLVIPAGNIGSRMHELNNVEEWAGSNNLCLNRKQTFEMIFTKPRDRNKCAVTTLAGIEKVTSLKVLGVTLIDNFSMTEHVSERIASSGQFLHALKILR